MSEWITAQPNPEHPETLPRVRMFAVLGTWMEADIVAATVRNLITQGCERVYLVDNDSPDDTVAVARSEGAIMARSYATERYDESIRLQHMNEVVADVSAAEPDDHLWWLFLDADEFHHGPFGMTLREYVRTLDRQFRVVGMRCFDHYPDRRPAYVGSRHPIDFQPLCEELAFPMCPSRHRKHPLLRWDRHGTSLHADRGFHLAHGTEPLHEPAEPAFLHHFPYREEAITRKKLQQVWAKKPDGTSRALESHDTHMLARARSLDAVYAQDWAGVVNFIALDPMYETLPERPPATGVMLRPWAEAVPPEHRHMLRGYSVIDAWRYDSIDKFAYGDDTTYQRGLAFVDGHGAIEDWGCGYRHAREFITKSEYRGIDGSSPYADVLADLRIYTSTADCIFMRHVLEHNVDWRLILANAVQSFTKRMALVIFTPFSETTRVINTSDTAMSTFIPDISFRKEDLTDLFRHLAYREESLVTDTQYGREHVFYIEKKN